MTSIDPRQKEYPWQSTYAYYANSPISTIDYLGGGKDGEYEIDENGNKVRISDMGDDEGIDYIHQRDNSTIIEDHETCQQIKISPTRDGRSLIKDYIKRSDDVVAFDIWEEFRFGVGPENSLFVGNHPMNLDIIDSPDFIDAQARFKKSTNLKEKLPLSSSFGLMGPFRAGTNMTAQMLGKFDVSFYPIGDKVVTLVTDSKSQNSYQPWYKLGSLWGNSEFGNHARDTKWRHNNMSNTRQSYLFVLPKSDF